MIDDLHELARAETGNVALRRQPVDLGDLVRAIGDEYWGAANASGLSLTVDVPEDSPTVETDGARVRQIVGNLLSNAIKYTKAGSVVLRMREYPAEIVGGARGWVHFDVIDTGLGIPADKRDIISRSSVVWAPTTGPAQVSGLRSANAWPRRSAERSRWRAKSDQARPSLSDFPFTRKNLRSCRRDAPRRRRTSRVWYDGARGTGAAPRLKGDWYTCRG